MAVEVLPPLIRSRHFGPFSVYRYSLGWQLRLALPRNYELVLFELWRRRRNGS